MTGTRIDTVPRQRSGTRAPQRAARGWQVRAAPGRDPGGRTDIDGDVIEKTAVQAVRETTGARMERTRDARARVSGQVVLLRLRIAVNYPDPVRTIAARVREHVRERVEYTTGKQVHHIDIEIVEMVR